MILCTGTEKQTKPHVHHLIPDEQFYTQSFFKHASLWMLITFQFKSIKPYYKDSINDRQPVSAVMRGYVGVQTHLPNKAFLVREEKPISCSILVMFSKWTAVSFAQAAAVFCSRSA